jgi:hypothetical protein
MTKREIAGFWRRVATCRPGHIIGADNEAAEAVKLVSAGSPVNASASPTQAASAVTAKGIDVGSSW